MSALADVSLLSGAMTLMPPALVVVGLLVLVIRRGLRWWATVAVLVVVSAAVVVGARYYVEQVWRPFPDALPTQVYLWAGAAILAALLSVAGLVAALARPPRRALPAVAIPVAAALAVVGACGGINLHFASYPTLGSVVGVKDYREVSAADLAPGGPVAAPATGATTLADTWVPPASMPDKGAVSRVHIPGTASGFQARDAIVVVPPAYLVQPRPLLPVLVLLAGQPGGPEDWMRGGRLSVVSHRYAAQHGGLAPVVVVADATGDELGNTLCVDSKRGNAQTYLTVDVPRWIENNLQVGTGRAIGGLSFGGTCALQLSLAAPQVYPLFVDISGQAEPTLGDRRRTVEHFFDGDERAFRAQNPADLLSGARYENLAGMFVVGDADAEYRPAAEAMHRAAVGAGVDARLEILPGGHDFALWSGGLEKALPWMSARTGLAR